MNDNVSIIVTRPSGRPLQYSLRYKVLKLLCVFGVILMALLVVSLGANFVLARHYVNTNQYTDTQASQSKVIQSLQDEVQSLRDLVQDLIKKEEEIRQDLGKPRYRKLSKRRRIQRKVRAFSRKYPQPVNDVADTHQISHELHYIKSNVLSLEKKMRRYMSVYQQYQEWFDQTPSIWPVYGYIRSGYGYRMHPLKRKKQFHKGVDIPAWIGAPVQATADGYVSFAGWGGGYGWIVVISHSFGYQTIYAHLSELEVYQGGTVFKGQIIGKIGTSGLSTGPHVHYEILRRRKAINPMPYLKLNLFTAVSKLW
jgi:murein DD-endopeptidase MepM/ murein hydrolase activator NlpD